MNTRGEKFDIHKTGQMEFIRVPYECMPDGANGCGSNFTVHAMVQGVSESQKDCGRSQYITSLHFGGAWLEERGLEVQMIEGEMVVFLERVPLEPSPQPVPVTNMVQIHMPQKNMLHIGAGSAWVDVTSDLQPVHFFLNMKAEGLESLGCRIGGLLGEDDHADVSELPSGCPSILLSESRSQKARQFHASAHMEW